MIKSNCGVFSHSSSSFETDVVILQRVAEYLGPRDVSCCERVCRRFYIMLYNDQEIWTQLFLREGIPLVEGKNRNRRWDFQVLYPMTLSGAKISRTIGKVMGSIPCISSLIFERLHSPDPFDEKKLMKENWIFVVDPAYVKREVGPQMPFVCNREEKLVQASQNQIQSGRQLKIPLSLKNLNILCSYPLKGKENTPVFSQIAYVDVFDECDASSDRINETTVHFIRKQHVKETKGLSYFNQEKLLKECGCDVMSTRIRVLSCAITILDSGTCFDCGEEDYTYCSDIFYTPGGEERTITIGGFALNTGMDVFAARFNSCEDASMIPCISACGSVNDYFPVQGKSC